MRRLNRIRAGVGSRSSAYLSVAQKTVTASTSPVSGLTHVPLKNSSMPRATPAIRLHQASLTCGMPSSRGANCDNLQTISKSKLGAYITHLAPEKLRELRDAIGFALGFDSIE